MKHIILLQKMFLVVVFFLAAGTGSSEARLRRNVKEKHKGPYPDLVVITYDKDRAWNGNVIFVDKDWHRIIEATLEGDIVWDCPAPEAKICSFVGRSCGARLSDVELLPNGNVLALNGGDGVYEINRNKNVVWSYNNEMISHDADRLANGNTIMACVGSEQASDFPYEDPQAIEIDKNGNIVWAWHAKDEYADSIYRDIRSNDANDWTHMNSVQRFKEGYTLLSLRNWNLLLVVDDNAKTVWYTGSDEIPYYGWGNSSPHCPHTPVFLDNGNIMVSEPINGRVIEWNPERQEVVWSYPETTWRYGGPYYFIRAAHRLPNGNTFIIDSCGQFVEVTPDCEIVWHAQLADYKQQYQPPRKGEINKKAPCFNADRRGMPYYGGR